MTVQDEHNDLMATEGQDWYDDLGRSHWYLVGRYRLTLDLCRPLLPSDGWIVDVGCGPGCLMDGLRGHGPVMGLDLAGRALAYARSAGHPYLAKGSVLHLPLPAASAKFVLAQDVLEHILEDEQALGEMARVLAPGGWMFVCVPAFELLRGRHDDLYGHHRRYLVHELREKVRRAGLRVRKITYVQAVLFPLLLLFRKWKNLTGSEACDFQPARGPVNAFLTWLITVERRWLKYVNMPVGCNVVCLAQKPVNAADRRDRAL